MSFNKLNKFIDNLAERQKYGKPCAIRFVGGKPCSQLFRLFESDPQQCDLVQTVKGMVLQTILKLHKGNAKEFQLTCAGSERYVITHE